MTRMQVFIPDDLYKKLKTKSKQTDQPMAQFIRQGLELVLNRHKIKEVDPMKDFVGQAKTKKVTHSVNDIKGYYLDK